MNAADIAGDARAECECGEGGWGGGFAGRSGDREGLLLLLQLLHSSTPSQSEFCVASEY
jgi:hypothetical protein